MLRPNATSPHTIFLFGFRGAVTLEDAMVLVIIGADSSAERGMSGQDVSALGDEELQEDGESPESGDDHGDFLR